MKRIILIIELIYLLLNSYYVMAGIWPVPNYEVVVTNYGAYANRTEFHGGLDIPAPEDTSVVAVSNGTIIFIDVSISNDHKIILQGDAPKPYIYAHIYASIGDIDGDGEIDLSGPVNIHVSEGQPIAKIAPRAPFPHLEIRIASTIGSPDYINPLLYLTPHDPPPPNGNPPIVEIFRFKDYNNPANNNVPTTEPFNDVPVIISGDVDIVVRVTDDMGANYKSRMVAVPYSLSYWVKGPTPSSSIGSSSNPWQLFRFDSTQNDKGQGCEDDLNIIYDTQDGENHIGYDYYNYFVTHVDAQGRIDGNQFWDTKKFPDGTYYVYVKAADIIHETAAWAKVIVDNFIPEVESTTPANGANNVNPTTDIIINFSEPMDRIATEGAFSITPSVSGTFSWSNDDKTLTFHPSSNLQSNQKYTVTITTAAKDLGIHLPHCQLYLM